MWYTIGYICYKEGVNMPVSKSIGDKNIKVYNELSGQSQVVEILGNEELKVLEKFIQAPIILFNEKAVLYLNNHCKKMLGYEEGDLPKEKTLDIFKCFEKENLIQYIQRFLETDTFPIRQEISMLKKDKSKLLVELMGKTVIYNSQRCIFGSLKDISYVRKLELYVSRISKVRTLMLETTRLALQIEDINELLQLILKNALKSIKSGTAGSILIKEGNHFTVASQIGFSENIKDFLLPIEDAFLYKATNGRMDRIANISDLMTYKKYYLIKTNYGEENYIKSTLTAPIYIKGDLFGMINIDSFVTNSFDEDDVKSMGIIRNYIEVVIENYLLYKEKSYLARYDQLTRLYNRYYFEEQIETIMEKTLRYKESFNLVIFDINNLKTVNDSFGHLAGDEIIKKFACELKDNTRKMDIIVRLGGDEFIGVFFNADIESLNKKLLNLLSKMENNPISINGRQIKSTFSYGIANFPQDGICLRELIMVADDRMYNFKGQYKKHMIN